MKMLSLTFRGPFVFEVPPRTAAGTPSPTVNIHAPQCVGHLGSVFFGDGAAPVYGNRQGGRYHAYSVTGAAPAPGNTGLVTNPGKISYQWDTTRAGSNTILTPDDPAIAYTPNLEAAYFRITVPRPSILYALNTILDTEVVAHGSAPTHVFNKAWATAFRLYYEWDLVTAIHMQPPANQSSTYMSITPPAGATRGGLSGWLPLSDSGDIEFQFEGPGTTDPDHQDAGECFSQIAKLAGVPWWLNFKNGPGSGGAAFHTGSDCQALPVVLGLHN